MKTNDMTLVFISLCQKSIRISRSKSNSDCSKDLTQSVIACLMLTKQTLEQGVKCIQS